MWWNKDSWRNVLPYIHFLGAWLVSDHLWCHPCYSSRKGHFCRLFIPGSTCAKIRYFHNIIFGNKNTGKNKINSVWNEFYSSWHIYNCISLFTLQFIDFFGRFFHMHIYDRIMLSELVVAACEYEWPDALLRRLEVSVNDLVTVKVVHATGYLLGPVQDQSWWNLLPVPQDFVQLTVGTVLHDDAITWSLCTHTPTRQNILYKKNTDIEAFSLDFRCISLLNSQKT